MNILDPDIDRYLNDAIPERDSVLAEMEQLANEREFPIVGPLVGRLCFQLVKLTRARNILELGSGFGYSALWMAMALPNDGRIVLTEKDPENLKMAKLFFHRSGLTAKATFKTGHALEMVAEMDEVFDIILNDIDKEDYARSLELILPRLKKGGILITDNLLWGGRVTHARPDSATKSIQDYTKSLYRSERLMTTIIPLRDGVGISLYS